MTQQQWNAHIDHMRGHITWPASKQQIVGACKGEDVEANVLIDLKANLPNGTYKNVTEVMKILVK